MKKKILSLILALAMLCSMLCIGSVTAFAEATQWDGTAAASFAQGGDGSAGNPYKIATAAELKLFANIVNGLGGQTQNTAACAVLTADIVLNPGTFDTDGNYTAQNGESLIRWFPIGYYYDTDGNSNKEDVYFNGTFDGNEHTVSGLYFNNAEQSYVGLFGQTEENAVIVRVGVINSDIRCLAYVGGVCGINKGKIESSYFSGTIRSISDKAGGVCGTNEAGASVTSCYNAGTVGGQSQIGGVCGYNYNELTGCYNTGTVSSANGYAGGVCGNNYPCSSILHCYNTGTVTSQYKNVGGVCGYVDSGSSVTSCYNTGTVSGESNVGGVYGANNSGTIQNCYYLNTCGASGGGTSKTAEQFASGEVAYLLNGSTSEGELTWYIKNGLTTLDKAGDIAVCENGKYSTKRNPYYNTTVTYDIEPYYTVTIPKDAQLNTDFELSAKDVVLEVGKQLVVTVSGTVNESGNFTVTNGKTGVLSYTLTDKNNAETIFANHAAVLAVDPDTGSTGAVTLHFSNPLESAKYSGNYSGTLTFTVAVKDKES